MDELSLLDDLNRLLYANGLAPGALRRELETIVSTHALRSHYLQHPEAQPSLAEVALALAAQDGSPLAERPDLIAAAAQALADARPDADADDVLATAAALERKRVGRALDAVAEQRQETDLQ